MTGWDKGGFHLHSSDDSQPPLETHCMGTAAEKGTGWGRMEATMIPPIVECMMYEYLE